MPYAQVAVDAPAPLKTYSYLIPHELKLSVGQPVWVPFGRNSPLVQGIVFGFSEDAPVAELKPVAAAIDDQPVISVAGCRLAEWLSDYYYSPLFDCAALLMPPGFHRRVKTALEAVAAAPASEGTARPPVPERARIILDYLETRGGPVDLAVVRRAFGPNTDGDVERLAAAGLVKRTSRLPRASVGPRYTRRLRLAPLGQVANLTEAYWRNRPRQRELIQALRDRGGSMGAEELGGSGGVASLLAERGFITVERDRVTRDPLAGRAFQESFPPPLTLHQENALGQIRRALAGLSKRSDGAASQPARASGALQGFLIHGVTGSGKTELYLQALSTCVQAGKRAIVLVPEIALEPQTVAFFSARFPGRVAVLHSGVSPGEAYDEWWRIRRGEFDVVIGSRSAVFAPQPDLGLIVVDEEHESTYKQQDVAPRYDARRVARERARLGGAVLVLGSATPDLGTYTDKNLRRLELPHRVLPATRGPHPGPLPEREGRSRRGLPQVEIVDLREELKAGNRSIFSRALQQGLAATLRDGLQAILFLNRRGTASFIQCRDCGGVVRCRSCEAPFTYHGVEDRLVCHQCNAHRRVPLRCRECGSSRIRYLGVGTQRVETEVKALFPLSRVQRWDRDTARNRRGHEEFLERFSRGDADVMVGTQMIAKGLDLPQVTLVGIVNADVNLYLPDFRAAERTFQLLTQVAGRAGRGEWPGRVLIQTYTPEHYAIQAAAQQDYGAFLRSELAYRRRHGYPPAQPLIRLLYSDTAAARAQGEAGRYARALSTERARQGSADVQVMGPLPAYFRRVRGRYRWQVLLKGDGGRDLLDRCPPPRGWIVDVDPAHIL